LSRSCDIEKRSKLNRNQSHRYFDVSKYGDELICSAKPDAAAPNTPKVAGRIKLRRSRRQKSFGLSSRNDYVGMKADKHQERAMPEFCERSACGQCREL